MSENNNRPVKKQNSPLRFARARCVGVDTAIASVSALSKIISKMAYSYSLL